MNPRNPSAVGGDIGCGMLALAFDASADLLRDPGHAGALLRALGQRIPAQRRHRTRTLSLPADLTSIPLSDPALASLLKSDGALQFGPSRQSSGVPPGRRYGWTG